MKPSLRLPPHVFKANQRFYDTITCVVSQPADTIYYTKSVCDRQRQEK